MVKAPMRLDLHALVAERVGPGCNPPGRARTKVQPVSGAGFTLVELLVVISIIGILSGFLFVNFANVRERGRDSQRKRDLDQIKTALRLFYNDYQRFPASNASGEIVGCNCDATGTVCSACTWGSDFGDGTTSYMTLPADPINTAGYVYEYNATSADTYTITATLENLGDPQIEESQTRCGVAQVNLTNDSYMICSN